MTRFLILAGALTLATAAHSADFRSRTGLKVRQVEPAIYEVYGVPNYGPSDYWCTMGEYALRVLRADYTARLFVVGDYQRGQRSYRFSTAPVGEPSETSWLKTTSIRKNGANRAVNAAYAECYNRHPLASR